MTDYKKLVAALRCENTGDDECGSSDCPYWSGLGCMDGQLMEDAAAAIEALQAEVEELKAKKMKLAENSLRFVGKVRELDKRRLEPKRGEWVEDTTTYAGPGLSNYKCSLCGKICGTWRSGLKPSELPNWCGNCGADMRAKMEVSE